MTPIRLAIVAGEESGDLLGADLVDAMARQSGRPVELLGVGGRHLEKRGLHSLFPSEEIALMGITAVVRDLPRLIGRIGSTARAISEAKPDCLVTIDSPEFSLRVANKVRALAPDIPVVHYVCPSVWAWRPGRAPAMKPYVDEVLCLLPFEPDALQKLGGPIGTFVGHRLTRDPDVQAAEASQAQRRPTNGAEKTLLVLLGSRRSEISMLLEPFRETVSLLKDRGANLRLLMPTVPKLEAELRQRTASWPVRPEITSDAASKWRAFGEADAALAASGTVTLELALCGVPLVSCYRLDWISRRLNRLFTGWSASLPNLIADKMVVPEFINEFLRPTYVARYLESLLAPTAQRQWQLDGFNEIRLRMATERSAGEIAAERVLARLGSQNA
jgi:lipid-A-disaccharide synthase